MLKALKDFLNTRGKEESREFLQYQLVVIQEVQARESLRRIEQYRHELKIWDLKGGKEAHAVWAEKMRQMKPSTIPRKLMQTLSLKEEVAVVNKQPLPKSTPEETKVLQDLLLSTCLN